MPEWAKGVIDRLAWMMVAGALSGIGGLLKGHEDAAASAAKTIAKWKSDAETWEKLADYFRSP